MDVLCVQKHRPTSSRAFWNNTIDLKLASAIVSAGTSSGRHGAYRCCRRLLYQHSQRIVSPSQESILQGHGIRRRQDAGPRNSRHSDFTPLLTNNVRARQQSHWSALQVATQTLPHPSYKPMSPSTIVVRAGRPLDSSHGYFGRHVLGSWPSLASDKPFRLLSSGSSAARVSVRSQSRLS